MEPAEAINTVESVLRSAIREQLGERWNPRGRVDVAVLEQRREEEQKRRNGARVETDLLEYTHIWDLLRVVLDAWEMFKPIFKDQARFKAYMGRLEDLRNAPMHSRTLLPFERDLLAGIAGEIRNSLTVWRSEQAPDMTWYPTIETITDSFGNVLTSPSGIGNFVVPMRLQVGQTVTFRCVATDPGARELTWTLNEQAGHGPQLDSQVGDEVDLRWQVASRHVAETSIVVIRLASNGEYHRFQLGVDAQLGLHYSVEPPH